MLATGKQISIREGNIEIVAETVPVFRNGKPTKRTKTIRTIKKSDALADSYMIDGHEVYMIREEVEDAKKDEFFHSVRLFREDSSRIFADCTFGRTGAINHKVLVRYNVIKNRVEVYSTGYDGPMGKGHGAYIRRINW